MTLFQRNLPHWERLLRLAGAAALAITAWAGPAAGWLTLALLASAATLAITALAGFCPACAMAGRRLRRPAP
jgi:hypothetical protein